MDSMTSLWEKFQKYFVVYEGRSGPAFDVEEGITSGDYLHGFLRGTRAAIYEKDRESITISILKVNAFQIGSLIALYERAVGFYGSLVNVNAYHQPGVEAGKKAATRLLELQSRVHKALSQAPAQTSEQLAQAVNADAEDVYHALRHLAANDRAVASDSSIQPSQEKFFLR